jgi:copper chaperone CopZ
MFRRNFITRLAMSSVSTVASVKTVTYRIKGFSCLTCAVGLDTLLSKEPGVIRAKSSYPDATTIIEFRPSQTNEDILKNCISEMGFTATAIAR